MKIRNSILMLAMFVFFISCQEQNRVTSEFAVVEDNTSNGVEKPVDEPTTDGEQGDSGGSGSGGSSSGSGSGSGSGGETTTPTGKPELTEEELDLRVKYFNQTISGNNAPTPVYLNFYGTQVNYLKDKDVKTTAKITVTERTENVNAKDVIANISYSDSYVEATFQTRVITLGGNLSTVLPTVGSYAKVEVEIYIQDTKSTDRRFSVTTRKVTLILKRI